MLLFDHYCVEDDDETHYISKRQMHNVMLFGMDMISKDAIFRGHWPHHIINYQQFIEKLYIKCSQEFDDRDTEDIYEVETTGDEEKELQQLNKYIPAFEYDTKTKK